MNKKIRLQHVTPLLTLLTTTVTLHQKLTYRAFFGDDAKNYYRDYSMLKMFRV